MLQLFAGHRTRAGETLTPAEVIGRPRDVVALDVDLGLDLRRRGEQSPHVAHRLAELRIRLLERDPGVRWIELDQRLPGLDELRVVGGDADDRTGDLRRDLHDVAADV